MSDYVKVHVLAWCMLRSNEKYVTKKEWSGFTVNTANLLVKVNGTRKRTHG